MEDRFGQPPPEVEHLALGAQIRIIAEGLRLPRVEFKRNRLFLTVPPQSDTHFYESIFRGLLQTLSELDNRYVIKEIGSKTQIIVQDVANSEDALAIMEMIEDVATVSPA